MRKEKEKKKGRIMWGFLYTGVFIAAFAASAVFKIKGNSLGKKYTPAWNDSVGKVYTDLVYGEGEANKFDPYVPAETGRETYGLVVYLHAGGLTTGDKSGDAEMLKWLCSKGYVAAGVNYTLRDGAHPDASVYSQSMEIKSSIPAIVQEAEKLGYRLDRMAVSGGSAGGCLALIYAYRDAAESPLPVRMVFEMVGPASFYAGDWTTYGLDKSAEAAAELFGVMAGREITADMIGTPAYDEAVKDISAFMWVNENSAPTVCAYGKYDKVCPFESAKHLIRALEENHVPHEYIEFPHSGHGLQNDNKLYAELMEKIEEYLDRYMGS